MPLEIRLGVPLVACQVMSVSAEILHDVHLDEQVWTPIVSLKRRQGELRWTSLMNVRTVDVLVSEASCDIHGLARCRTM